MNFNIQTAAMFVFFVSDKSGLIKSCSSFEDLSVYKISWSHVDWCKFCIHFNSFNVYHFGMLEGTGLKSMPSRSSSIQTGDLISLTFLFKESRLKKEGKPLSNDSSYLKY
jgi:hypothetical protein